MNEQTQRYPLAWPMNWKRTPPKDRRRASFRGSRKTSRTVSVEGINRTQTARETITLTIAASLDRLEAELRRLGATDEILSSNVPVGLKGMPLSVSKEPPDPGVAVYITLDRKPLVFACDKWDRVADNIAAVAQHIDALRRIERYGVGRIEQAFVGYAALPVSTEDWRVVLGVGEYATRDQVDAAFLEKARTAHPDAGGSHEEMARLTAARDLARSVLRS